MKVKVEVWAQDSSYKGVRIVNFLPDPESDAVVFWIDEKEDNIVSFRYGRHELANNGWQFLETAEIEIRCSERLAAKLEHS